MERDILFLLKTNEDDRDCVKYIEFKENESFGFCGACFWGLSYELDKILENYNELTTILTREELKRLFELNKHFERTQDNLEFINLIKIKLKSNEAIALWEKVQEEEKDYLYNEYNLDYNDIEEILDYYYLPYRDRAIISCTFDDFEELGEEEFDAYNPDIDEHLKQYIDYEAFGKDLANQENYYTLDDGRIIYLNY